MTKLPKKVYIASDKAIPVVQKKLEYVHALGYYDQIEEQIAIEIEQEELGKWIVLIHEVLHALDAQNVANGLYKRKLTEDQVTYLASGLFASFALSGGLPKFNKRTIINFFKEGT